MIFEMFYNREAAFAFCFDHVTRVRPEVAEPQEIRTVEHKAWQAPNFPVAKSLLPVVREMLAERLRNGVLEKCYGPYRNPWFLVKKKESGKYRLINAAMEMNRHTIRDANLPPSVDEFSEEFAGCHIASLVDLYSGYDQIPLAKESRDLTAFYCPGMGLLRMTTLPQGATNSVAQFVRIVEKVLQDLIPDVCVPFLDDIGVKGPTTDYSGEEVAPGVRQYVLEHFRKLDKVFADLERAGLTIGPKSQFGMQGMKVVGFVCGAEGRTPESSKVIKILDWKPCTDVTEVRAFLGVCVYYRIWISDFIVIIVPLYYLTKKNVEFEWCSEQQESMDRLKIALTTAPALVKLSYATGAGRIIVAVDASLHGWGGVVMQEDENGKRHPSRYESGIWNHAEREYDATKRECRGVLKMLKKVRFYLYGIHFTLETDANVLVAQLNGAASDIPGALVMRWIAWIRLFDFEVKHVPRTKHTAADGLSRRARTASDDHDDEIEDDIDDFIAAQLGALRIAPVRAREETPDEPVLEGDDWSEDSKDLTYYLTMQRRPRSVALEDFRKFRRRATNFLVQNKILWQRHNKNRPQRRVVDGEERGKVIESMHDESGHKGREGTYHKIAQRYFWEGCFKDVKEYVESCPNCQLRSKNLGYEALYATWATGLWERVGIDITELPPDGGCPYLIVAREGLSGWAEARPLRTTSSALVAKFLWEDVIYRHGLFGRLIVR